MYIDVEIHIDAKKWLSYYRQPNTRVQSRALDGRIVELLASKLQPFVSHAGVSGRFRLTLDSQNKLLNIQKITDK